ncbi:uncharacterized protein LOC144158709 isoform X2 [Haemaphysalis longicornis]
MPGHRCAAKWCRKSSVTYANLGFYRFPADDRATVWIEYANRADLNNVSREQLRNAKLCACHFTRDAFKESGRRSMGLYRKLKEAAVPTVQVSDPALRIFVPPRPETVRLLPPHLLCEDNYCSRESKNTTALTRISRGTSSMPDSCVMAMPVVTAHPPVVSCSQRTQAAITTMTIGTQCCLGLLTSTSSQTEEFPDVENALSGAFGKFPASQDGAGILTKADPHTCSCQPRSRNTEFFLNDNGEVEITGKLYSSQSCQQCNQHTTLVKVCSSYLPSICSVCEKAFRKKHNLDIHMRVHSGERPYVCRICHKTFAYKSTMVSHERLHSGERPWICSICQKSFAKKSNLVRHESVHCIE